MPQDKEQMPETEKQRTKVAENSDSGQMNTENKEKSGNGNGNKQATSGNDKQTEGMQKGNKESVRADKGTGYFPLSDMQFDVVTIIYEKSKALQAYDKYLLDCQPSEELREVIECIKKDDREHVEKLKQFLGKE